VKAKMVFLTALASAVLLGHQPAAVVGPNLKWLNSSGLCAGATSMYQSNDYANIDISDLITCIGEVGKHAEKGRSTLRADLDGLEAKVAKIPGTGEGIRRSQVIALIDSLARDQKWPPNVRIGELNSYDKQLQDSISVLRKKIEDIHLPPPDKGFTVGQAIIPAAAVSLVSLVFALAF